MARYFNGSSSCSYGVVNPIGRVDVAGTQITISAWIKPDAGFTSDHRFIVCKSAATPASAIQYQLWLNVTDGRVVFATSDGTNTDSIASAGPPTAGVWRWVAARKLGNAAGQLGIWTTTPGGGVGTQWSAGTGAHSIGDTSRNFIIGASDANTFRFVGSIAEVAVWNTALSDAQLAAVGGGQSPLVTQVANLACYFPLYGEHGTSQPEYNYAPLGSNPLTWVTSPGTVPASDHFAAGSPPWLH